MRFSPRYLLLLITAVAGCVSVPNQDLAQLSSPIALQGATEEALTHPQFHRGEWPSSRWWEIFADPQLNQLMETALSDSPTLKQAEAKLEFAKQIAKKERSLLLPKLDMNYDEQWQYFSKEGFVRSFYPTTPGIGVPATVNQVDLTLNFSYEFDFWGKNRKRFQAALGEVRTMQAERAQAELILTTYLAQTYFELQAHLAKQAILQEQFDQRSALYNLTRARRESGIDPDFPVLDTQKHVFAIEQLLLAVKREVACDQHLIKMLIGQGPDSPNLPLPLSAVFDRPFPLPHNLAIDLLARRPDLQAQIWRVESAAQQIGVAKAEFYPNVNLCAFAGLESLAFKDLFHWSSHRGGVEPALHLPIFTGGKLRANLRSKVAAYNEAVFTYNDLLLHASKEVADYLIVLQTKNLEKDIQLTTVQLAQDQYQLNQSRFEKGVNNYLSVLDTEGEVLSQKFTLANLRRDCLLAVLNVIKAFGGGYAAFSPSHPPHQEESPHAR